MFFYLIVIYFRERFFARAISVEEKFPDPQNQVLFYRNEDKGLHATRTWAIAFAARSKLRKECCYHPRVAPLLTQEQNKKKCLHSSRYRRKKLVQFRRLRGNIHPFVCFGFRSMWMWSVSTEKSFARMTAELNFRNDFCKNILIETVQRRLSPVRTVTTDTCEKTKRWNTLW